MATIKLQLYRKVKSVSGLYPVIFVISGPGKSAASFSSGVRLRPMQWKDNKIVNHPQATALMSALELRLSEYRVAIVREELSTLPAKKIKEALLKVNYAPEGFFDAAESFLSSKSRLGTLGVYRQTLKNIQAFVPNAELRMEDITPAWLEDFDRWMANGKDVNTRSIHLRNIRAIFNYAIDHELVSADSYPFRRFRIKSKPTRKRALSVDFLCEIRDKEIPEWQERYRDIFMLSFYLIGINMADLLTAKPEALSDGRLRYERAKTGRPYDIKVEWEAQELINKYKGKDYLINVMDKVQDYRNWTHRAGAALKQLSGLPDLSFYWARHTWATIAASLDIPKETIAAALGHADNSVTDIYIAFDRAKVDEANRRVLDHLIGL